ncbi:DUF4192 domain-containing protein [Actinoplanes oblitus]|uniref:DUF4192 domain-containing protein n=1 Tax=Actinoplanes oblitus TaxID=3040509 RepID=A0ABY8WSR6_9ACTN|nr:DUF4192 domain-containing protein [Actinoplanes oblitus]WIN00037.1 DUF4192 domain-containing protein [Actinoplanes oblitus]
MPESAYMTVRGPADLLATVPYLMGYHPRDCVVVVFVTENGRVKCVFSTDRQKPAPTIVQNSIATAISADTTAAFIIGYGPMTDRDPLIQIADRLHHAVSVQACLLVNNDRYYCLNQGCPCTPAGGAILDVSGSVMAAEMTLQGRVALPSRQDVEALAAADTEAQARTAALIAGLPSPPADPVGVVHSCMACAETAERLSDDQVALLAVALTTVDGRTAAWEATTGTAWQGALWLDLTRRVPEQYVATPANLLAWTSWRRGEPALARTALDTAATAMPGNTLSNLIGVLLNSPINPDTLPWPLPEDFDPRHLIP